LDTIFITAVLVIIWCHLYTESGLTCIADPAVVHLGQLMWSLVVILVQAVVVVIYRD